jgi:hypothetical protein
MNPVQFPEKNKTYTKPPGMTDEECTPLDVYENETQKISCWEATPIEALHFIFFRRVWLHVFLNIQPPVLITPEFPFTKTASGDLPEPIERIVEQMIDRKIKQFLIRELRKTENLQEISVIQSDWLKKLLIDYTNFFAGVKDDDR